MNLTRILTRGSVALAVVTLAACQTAPQRQTAAVPDTAPSPTTQPTPGAAEQPPTQAAAEQGAPVAVFLADMATQQGWRPIQVGSDSTLYLDPQPIVTREDLTGVQAGSNREGQGLLALMLSDSAKQRIEDLTTRNPNKRLALVVGRTLLAAPGYNSPVTTGQLIFPVGTEENATAAARAIAGLDGAAGGTPGGAGATSGGAGMSSGATGGSTGGVTGQGSLGNLGGSGIGGSGMGGSGTGGSSMGTPATRP